MLQQTFIHIPGIGKQTELDLWQHGIHSWDDAARFEKRFGAVGARLHQKLDEYIPLSQEAVRRKDAAFFERLSTMGEAWRVFPEFADECVYLDIETTGLSSVFDTRQLLTTSMLPKLANLWTQGRVVFLMATNHKEQLDPAITRSGRFDLLLCVGPPPLMNKIAGLAEVMKGSPIKDLPSVQKTLMSLCEATGTKKQLDLFTVAELRSFLDHLRRRDASHDLLIALQSQKKKEFKNTASEWAKTTIVLSLGSDMAKEYKRDFKASRRQ